MTRPDPRAVDDAKECPAGPPPNGWHDWRERSTADSEFYCIHCLQEILTPEEVDRVRDELRGLTATHRIVPAEPA